MLQCNITEGVGKSSLISTFVARHFTEVLPGLITQVRLPPEPESNCITTICDSQAGDQALLNARARSETNLAQLLQGGAQPPGAAASAGADQKVDSIILVYDLDRADTFYRLENHWLPLIERVYDGEVSIKHHGVLSVLFLLLHYVYLSLTFHPHILLLLYSDSRHCRRQQG